MTRGLLLCSILQALRMHEAGISTGGSTKLDAGFQKEVTSEWFRVNPQYQKLYPVSLVANFQDENWIEKNS